MFRLVVWEDGFPVDAFLVETREVGWWLVRLFARPGVERVQVARVDRRNAL